MLATASRSVSCVIALWAGAICLPASAQESHWEYVTGARLNGKTYHVQIDRASVRRVATKVTYWVRLVEGTPETAGNPFMRYGQASFGPSLYQDDCQSGQSRLMQGNILLGYEDGVIPISRPAPWEYVVPDSVAAIVHRHFCPKTP